MSPQQVQRPAISRGYYPQFCDAARRCQQCIDGFEIVLEGGGIATVPVRRKTEVGEQIDGACRTTLDVRDYEVLHDAIGIAQADLAVEC